MARYIDADILNADFIQQCTSNADVSLAVRKILDSVPTADAVPKEQYIELKCALDKAIDGKHKYGVMYEELSEEKAKLEDRIQYLSGMVEAFKIALNSGGV